MIDVVIVLNEVGCTYGNISLHEKALLDISKVHEKFRDKNLKIFLIIYNILLKGMEGKK